MISRLSAAAAAFSILATAGIAVAADAHQQRAVAAPTATAADAMTVVVLPRVEVVGRRSR